MKLGSDAEWKLLADLLEEQFGLSFTGVRREILESRLTPRFAAVQCAGPLQYYHHLRFHPERDRELAALPAAVTNNESFFFREAHHFRIITQHVVPALRDELRRRPLRILSAGCSSGEEPYSIVITLQEETFGQLPKGWEIDACDLNPARLAQAREAHYGENALRNCDEGARRRYFCQRDGRYVLLERYREGVRFFPANLAREETPLPWDAYDVILCRNLLIYFRDEAFLRTAGRLARALAPGGLLLLGHSESLIDREPVLQPVIVDGVVVYRRRLEAA